MIDTDHTVTEHEPSKLARHLGGFVLGAFLIAAGFLTFCIAMLAMVILMLLLMSLVGPVAAPLCFLATAAFIGYAGWGWQRAR